MLKKLYFLGKDEEKTILLFSVRERKNPRDNNFFDLELFFPGRGLFRNGKSIDELVKDTTEIDYKKCTLNGGPHISIHYHPGQPSIFINKTTTKNEGCKFVGIKDNKLFAPIILKIFGTTKTPQYIPKEKYNNKSIETGINFNSITDTLLMFFIVSKVGVEINKDPEYPANYYEKDFTDFRLTVIYRIFNKPPERPTINLSLITPPGDNICLIGFEWWQICNLLNDLEKPYVTAYFKKHPERNYPRKS